MKYSLEQTAATEISKDISGIAAWNKLHDVYFTRLNSIQNSQPLYECCINNYCELLIDVLILCVFLCDFFKFSVISLHVEMFVLPGGGFVAKIIRLFVEGKSPPFPDRVSSATADSGRGRDTAAAHEHSLLKQGLLLAFCAGGLLTFYLLWGLLQERIMAFNYSETESTRERFTNSQFLVFMNRIFALFVAVLVIILQRRHTAHQPPLYKYSYCSFSNIISSWCQYEALKFVSFPVQVSVLGTAHYRSSFDLTAS